VVLDRHRNLARFASPYGPGIKYKSVCGRLVVRRPKIGEDLFGPGVWVPPALTGNLVARVNECGQWTLAFLVGEVRRERLVGCIDLSPLANTLNRDDSISFGTEQRDYFGWLAAEITHAVPESVINTIASMVCHAHRMGGARKHTIT
jgi:hypothetical protein